jgi:hypothetical protein
MEGFRVRHVPQLRRPRLCFVLSSLTLALAFATGAPLRANGTIDTTLSSVSAGTAAVQGTVTIDPCVAPGAAPEMPSLGTLGTLGALGTAIGTIPPFPGGGTGADGAFLATADETLLGGTYELTSYRVDPGVVLNYAGPVTIRTTGDVVVDGIVIADQGGITFECAGDLSVRAQQDVPAAGFQTHGGRVQLDVAGTLRFLDLSPEGSSATTAIGTEGLGDVEFIARGGVAGAAMEVLHLNVTGARVRMRSATSLRVQAGIASFFGSPTEFQAFGGDFEIANSSVLAQGPLTVEASGAVRTSNSYFHLYEGDARITAFGGPVDLSGPGYVRTFAGGSLLCRAATSVGLHDGMELSVQEGDGTLEVTAFGGDVRFENLAGPGALNQVSNLGTGPSSLTASGAILLDDRATAQAQGDLTLRALGGDVTCSGAILVESVAGPLDMGALGDVNARAAGLVQLAGDSLRVFGARLDLTGELSGTGGSVTLTAREALAATGTMQGSTEVAVTSIDGDVTLDDAQITTEADVGARSGDIRIETFAGARGGRIAARSATVVSGDNETESGDVLLRVVTVPRLTVRSFLLPTSVTLKLGTARNAGLRAEGTIGCPAAWLTSASPEALPFVFDVGSRQIAGDLTPRPNGRDREFKAPGVLLRVSPSRTGTSEGVFSLRLDEDLAGKVSADGLVEFRLQQGGSDFRGTVRLVAGKFKLGSTRGAVAELLYPLAVAVQQKGGGKDAVAMTLGFASDGVTPDALPDLGIEFGTGFAVTVAAADFERSGDRFIARNPASAPGLTLVVVDFVKETVQVKGKNLDLGVFHGTGPVPARIGVAFGGDMRSVELTLSRKGTKLTY